MIWIIGAGNMAREYAKVLNAINKEYMCIGRSEKSADEFSVATGVDVVVGGLEKFLLSKPEIPEAVIVATDEKSHKNNCILLMKYGVKRILCEKPGFLYPKELEEVKKVKDICNAEIFYAYNRRFFAATLAAERIIEEDGGLLSFNFEFTEWGHVIATYSFPKETLSNWFYANSTHVIDLAFFIGGNPVVLTAYAKDKCDWHEPINFAGAGITDKGALFNYQANWDAPGRWAVELLTSKRRIYLKPMEKLQVQNKGSVKINSVEIDDKLDIDFKPGLYLQTKAFLFKEDIRLCSIEEQTNHLDYIYKRICKNTSNENPLYW